MVADLFRRRRIRGHEKLELRERYIKKWTLACVAAPRYWIGIDFNFVPKKSRVGERFRQDSYNLEPASTDKLGKMENKAITHDYHILCAEAKVPALD